MRAASSHTGALASADAVANAFLEQSGVIRVDTVEDLFDIAKSFDRLNIPIGNKVGILTNAGGPAILCVDECDKMGLDVPELNEKTKNEISKFAFPEASLHNPVDLLPPATKEMWADAAKWMIEGENIDSLIVIMGPPLMLDTVEIMTNVYNAVKDCGKPVLFTMMSQDENIPALQNSIPEHPPLYKYPESPARALGEMLNYKKYQTNEDNQKFKIEVQKDKVRGILDSIKTKGEFYLEFNDVYKILQCYGLPIIESVSVVDENEAVKASQQIGFPVVIKCIGKELIHKSDVGGVILNIKNFDELLTAIKEIKNSLTLINQIDKLEGFLIQPFFKGGIETILGVFKDKSAGHLIMFGLGGIMVEIMKDVKFRLIPITENDAFDMIKSIKGYKILEGFRGNEGIDINFLAENLMRLSKLIEDFPEIQEMDLNPFVFSNNHQKCKILDSRIKFLL